MAIRDSRVWQGEYPTPQTRRTPDQPLRSAGSHEDFDRPWHGDAESRFPTLDQAMDRATQQLGNILLYRGIKKADDSLSHIEQELDTPRLGAPNTSRTQKRGLAAGPQIMGELGAAPSPLALGPGPRVFAQGPVPTARPMPTRQSGFAPNRMATKSPIIKPDEIILPGGTVPGSRSAFQPDLSPNMSQPRVRRPAGMDPRKRGTWQRVD